MLHIPDWRNAHYAAELYNVMLRLYKIGAVKIDLEGGIGLREHRLGSTTPHTPIFFNLRNEENLKSGPLTEHEYLMAARVMLLHLLLHGVRFDAIAAIPNAGDPFARAAQKLLSPYKIVPLVPLKKRDEEIVVDGDIAHKLHRGSRVLLFDDVISGGGSKIPPIYPLRAAGYVVSDCCVLIDRQQGGRDCLAKADVRLHAPLTLRAAVEMGLHAGELDVAVKAAVLTYLAAW